MKSNGLVSKLGAAVLAVGGVFSGDYNKKADAGLLVIQPSASSWNEFRLAHLDDFSDTAADSSSDSYLPSPSLQNVDFYSHIVGSTPVNAKANIDARELSSFDTVRTYIEGNVVGPTLSTLDFSFVDIGNGDFPGKDIYADLYQSDGTTLIGTYDVRDLEANIGPAFPSLSVGSGISYVMDIRFEAQEDNPVPEPSTLALGALGAGAIGAYAAGRALSRRKEDKKV